MADTLSGVLSDDCCRIRFHDKSYASMYLAHHRGKSVLVTISPYSNKRTDRQNRYLWGVCYKAIADWTKASTGEVYPAEEIHAFVKTNILRVKYQIKHMFGKEFWVFNEVSTASMSVEEFTRAIEKIMDFFSERGCIFPTIEEWEEREKELLREEK